MRKSLFMSRLSFACSMVVASISRLGSSMAMRIGNTDPLLGSISLKSRFLNKPHQPSFNRVSQKKRRLYARRLGI